MRFEPTEEPASIDCKGRRLHWDKIAKLWVCTFCGSSLSYNDWNLGTELECRDPRPPAASSFRERRSRFWPR